MSDKRYLGNIITDTPTAPSSDLANSSAKGVWSLEEQLAYQKAGLWPVPGKFPVDITDVFSTYLYDGTSSAQTITNGIDLDGEGGLVWMKNRTSSSYSHALQHTTIANGGYLSSNSTSGFQAAANNGISAFNSNGFTFDTGNWEEFNNSSHDYASWTFRKAPKFFDVGTISFNSSGVGSYSHDLGVTPGMVIFKLTNTTGDWFVWHKDLTSQNYAMFLNASAASSNQGGWATYTDTTVTFDSGVFANDTAVVYLFAHNNNDGDFGPDGDADIIKCGSFEVTTGSTTVNVGFEPQFILHKRANASGNWVLWDTMRGYCAPDGDSNGAGGDAKYLYANLSNSEAATNHGGLTSNGFVFPSNFAPGTDPGDTYIYMAIRRGPLAVPEDATKVYQGDYRTGGFTSGFPVDFALIKNLYTADSGDWKAGSRLTQGKRLATTSTAAEVNDSNYTFDSMTGFYTSPPADLQSWMWKRAPGFFDAVAYTGNGTAGRTVSHNLGVAPEMMWIKKRNSSYEWIVYSPAGDGYLRLNTNEVYATSNVLWNATSPTATEFTLGGYTHVNGSGDTYIAYLFASAPGVSKVGSFTATGSALNIDCGFTSGARFVLIKRTNSTGDWFVFDSARGITSSTSPYLYLNSTSSENNADYIDPLASGFTVTTNFFGSGDFIFYAIA